MSAIDDLVTNNRRHAADDGEALPAQPSRRVAVVACMDARIDVYAALGLAAGEAHVIRNAGGVVTDDVIRSLAISQRLLGTREVMLVHHSRCGMLMPDDEEFLRSLEADAGTRPTWAVGSFTDLDDSVRACIRALLDSPFLTETEQVRGFVLDVGTGLLREVPPSPG